MTRRTAFILATCATMGIFSTPARGQAEADRIAEYVAQAHASGRLHGAVLVARGGDVLYEGGVGAADETWGVPNGPDVKYGLASITKTLTALLVLQQAERGALSLDAPALDYLPRFAGALDPRITLGHLLSHQSGLVDFANDLAWDEFVARYRSRPVLPDSIVADMLARPLEFEPGEGSDYNNTGYVLLGVVLEAVTGRPYCALLREEIFEPAGMADSGCLSFEAVVPRMATQYAMEDGEPRHVRYDHSVHADGLAYSTVRDLFRLDAALRDERLLSAAGQARMATPRVRDAWVAGHYGPRPSLGYGYGIAAWEMPGATPSDSVTVVGHGGAGAGRTTMFWRVPEDGVVVAVLSNRSIRPFPTYAALLDLAYGRPPAPPSSATGTEGDAPDGSDHR